MLLNVLAAGPESKCSSVGSQVAGPEFGWPVGLNHECPATFAFMAYLRVMFHVKRWLKSAYIVCGTGSGVGSDTGIDDSETIAVTARFAKERVPSRMETVYYWPGV